MYVRRVLNDHEVEEELYRIKTDGSAIEWIVFPDNVTRSFSLRFSVSGDWITSEHWGARIQNGYITEIIDMDSGNRQPTDRPEPIIPFIRN
jgi:hypothetical protein